MTDLRVIKTEENKKVTKKSVPKWLHKNVVDPTQNVKNH